MEHFLINSSVCLFVLWLVYKLLLENISWHVFKRVYLLGAIIVSVTIPFLVVKTVVVPVQELPVLEFQNSIAPQQVTQVTAETDFAIDWFYVALGVYLLGVCIMLFRYTKNLLAFQIQKNDVVSSYASYLLILRGEVTVPHSFWNRIFVSKKHYEQNQIPDVVLKHEKTHLDQKHSLDVLFVELLLVMFWFNPVLYMLRYAIKLNHEFLADQAVLKTGIATSDYQELILNHASSHYQHAIANTFNFPLIKKRFTIMKTRTSQRSLLFRSLIIVPVLTLLIISCGRSITKLDDSSTKNKIVVNNKSLVDEEEEKFNIWRVENDKTKSFPTAMDHVDFFWDKMNYFLDGKQINAKMAKEFLVENGQDGTTIEPVNGISSLKMLTIKNVMNIKNLNDVDQDKLPDSYNVQRVNGNDTIQTKFVIREEIEQEKELSEDEALNLRYLKTFLYASEQIKESVKYITENTVVSQRVAKTFINEYPLANVSVKQIDANNFELKFFQGNDKMSFAELQLEYTKLAENAPKTGTTYVMSQKFETIILNGQQGKGNFNLNGNTYSYKISPRLKLSFFNKQGNQLSEDELKAMKFVAIPLWDANKEMNNILNDDFIKSKFKENQAVFRYPKGYTNSFEDMSNVNVENTLLMKYIEHGKLVIESVPATYGKTNPSFIEFFKTNKF